MALLCIKTYRVVCQVFRSTPCVYIVVRGITSVMCENCLKEEYPNRERMCTDSGAYMANLKCCTNCSNKKLTVLNKSVTEVDEVEFVVYEHVCSDCQHVISIHNYKFWIEGDYQEYEMDCALCGIAEDSVSILPDDPRKMAGFELY